MLQIKNFDLFKEIQDFIPYILQKMTENENRVHYKSIYKK